jgi:hypothetical protein
MTRLKPLAPRCPSCGGPLLLVQGVQLCAYVPCPNFGRAPNRQTRRGRGAAKEERHMNARRATALIGGELGVPERRFAVVEETDAGPVAYVAASRVAPERVIAWMRTPDGELITAPGGPAK